MIKVEISSVAEIELDFRNNVMDGVKVTEIKESHAGSEQKKKGKSNSKSLSRALGHFWF